MKRRPTVDAQEKAASAGGSGVGGAGPAGGQANAVEDDSQPGGELRGSWRRWLLLPRIEEYAVLVFLVVFLVLHLTGIYTYHFATTFIRAGLKVFQLFTLGLLVATIYRVWQLKWWHIAMLLPGLHHLCWKGGLLNIKVFIPEFSASFNVIPSVVPEAYHNSLLVTAGVTVLALGGLVALALDRRELPVRPLVDRIGEFIRSWAPMILLISLYENALVLTVRLSPKLLDPVVYRLEETIFGGHLDQWMQRFASPGMNSFMNYMYGSLFLWPVLIGGYHYVRGQMRSYRNFMLAFTLVGFIGYAGYVAVPVVGPRFYYPHTYKVTTWGTKNYEKAPMDHIGWYPQSANNVPRNCFPSLHTAWGVIILVMTWKHVRLLFLLISFPVFNMIVATIYLRWHYLVDDIAGTALALIVCWAVPRLDGWWERRQVRAGIMEKPHQGTSKWW